MIPSENTREPVSISEISCLASSADADKYDGPEPPQPKTCEFCGAMLYWVGFQKDGRVSSWAFPHPCNCDGAVKRRAEEKQQHEREERERQREDEQRRKQARIERLIGDSGMGRRFQQRTFDAYQRNTPGQARAWEIAKSYADGFRERLKDGRGLFFAGGVGTGKTHLAAAIALSVMQSGTACIFRTGIDMFADIRKAYNGAATEAEYMGLYKTIDLLVIDDLGKEKMTEWAASTLYSIINARYEDLRPTVITTNFDPADLVKTLGEEPTRAQAIISRLMETSEYVPMDWADHRRTR